MVGGIGVSVFVSSMRGLNSFKSSSLRSAMACWNVSCWKAGCAMGVCTGGGSGAGIGSMMACVVGAFCVIVCGCDSAMGAGSGCSESRIVLMRASTSASLVSLYFQKSSFIPETVTVIALAAS